MKLSIIGCPDKERFRPYVKRAVQFYSEKLMSKKMLENINLIIRFDKTLDVYGYAHVCGYNNSNQAREFTIEINPGIGARNILETLAHEMVHIKQFSLGETNESLTRWKGTSIDSENVDYYDHPWEIEAHGMEAGLFTKFVRQEKLWEVFESIMNPDRKLEHQELGWRHYPT